MTVKNFLKWVVIHIVTFTSLSKLATFNYTSLNKYTQ